MSEIMFKCPCFHHRKQGFIISTHRSILDFHEPALTTFTLPPLALEWEIPPVVRFRLMNATNSIGH